MTGDAPEAHGASGRRAPAEIEEELTARTGPDVLQQHELVVSSFAGAPSSGVD